MNKKNTIKWIRNDSFLLSFLCIFFCLTVSCGGDDNSVEDIPVKDISVKGVSLSSTSLTMQKGTGLNGNWIFLISGGYCSGNKQRYILSGEELLAGYTGGGPYYVPFRLSGCFYWTRNLYNPSTAYHLQGNSISTVWPGGIDILV